MSRAIIKMRVRGPIVIVGSVAGTISSADGTTHSLGNIDVGAASGSKDIILGITWLDSNTRTISSLTVGGVALTEQITRHDPSTFDVDAAIWTADISSINGSQAISVTFDNAAQSVAVSGVAVSMMRSLTPDNSAGDDSNNNLVLANLAAPAGGIVFGVAASTTHDTSATWGSLTERADVATGGSSDNDHIHTSAWDAGFHAKANETMDFVSGTTTAAVGAGFR